MFIFAVTHAALLGVLRIDCRDAQQHVRHGQDQRGHDHGGNRVVRRRLGKRQRQALLEGVGAAVVRLLRRHGRRGAVALARGAGGGPIAATTLLPLEGIPAREFVLFKLVLVITYGSDRQRLDAVRVRQLVEELDSLLE